MRNLKTGPRIPLSNVYKTLPALTNLYRTLRAPLLKSNHCTQPMEMIAAIDLNAHRGGIYESQKTYRSTRQSNCGSLHLEWHPGAG
jgi:hypothetical protein